MLKKILISLIRFYKGRISPMTMPRCKYIPTCSEYAVQAIEKYGAMKGSFMAGWRILRCNPLSKGGFDPIK